MGKMKEFLFPGKDNNELDSTTVVLEKTKNGIKEPSKPLIISPTMFAQVEDIANDILKGKSVIVDLTMTDITEAKRICDFLNGVTFALEGKVEKVAKLVYLFSPKS